MNITRCIKISSFLFLIACTSNSAVPENVSSISSHSEMMISKFIELTPRWSENGTECYVSSDFRDSPPAWVLAVKKATSTTFDMHIESACSMSDGSTWFTGSTFEPPYHTVAHIWHVGSGGLLETHEGITASGGDISICPMTAIRDRKAIFSCVVGDGGWMGKYIIELDLDTGEKKTMYASDRFSCIYEDDVCVVPVTDASVLAAACHPIQRSDALKISQELDYMALGFSCSLQNGNRIITFVAGDDVNRKTGVALLSATGGVIDLSYASPSNKTPVTTLVPPHVVGIANDRYHFMTDVQTETEKHRHVFYVDVSQNRLTESESDDVYLNPDCSKWGVCDSLN